MILLADGGSTKVDWVLRDGDVFVEKCTTVGLNPVHVSEQDIERVLEELVSEHVDMHHVSAVEFYGSGCMSHPAAKMKRCLHRVFGETVDGFDVIDRIAKVPVDRMDRPLEDVRIITIKEVLPEPEAEVKQAEDTVKVQ